MKADKKTLVIKCYNAAVHKKAFGEGNILFFMRKNSIYVKCRHCECKRWNRITVNSPGCHLNFSVASFVQTLMPRDFIIVHDNIKEIGDGNVLFYMNGNSIFIKCSDYHCNRWTRIDIKFDGIDFDFSNASFIQGKMPENYHFDAVRAPVIIEEEYAR